MAAIINALFGSFSQSEEQNLVTDTNQNQNVTEQSAASNECLHTSAIADNVQVKSVISSETQANAAITTKLNINSLLAQLNTTHAQVDEYSRTRTAQINEQVQKSIADVLANTQRQQENLLASANQRHLIIDNEYKIQLQKAIEALDAIKAKTLADLERDLQAKQQLIMDEAKKQIDLVNDQANTAKLDVIIESHVLDKVNIDNLADQVLAIGQHETQHLLQSTTTTVITSQSQATANTQTIVTADHNQLQASIKSESNLTATSISPIAAAANVALNSNVIESIINNARARSRSKAVEPVATTAAVANNNKIVDPITAAANVALNSSVIESIVTNASAKSKNKTAEPAATNVGVTNNNKIVNPIAVAANVALNSNVVESIVNNASARSKNKIVEPAAITTDVTSNNNIIQTEVKPPQDNTVF